MYLKEVEKEEEHTPRTLAGLDLILRLRTVLKEYTQCVTKSRRTQSTN